MIAKKIAGGYLLRLVRGEELVRSLTDFCKDKKIAGGWFSGLGGIVSARVGYYNLQRRKYVFRHIKNVRELTCLSGNVAWVGDEPVLHLHGTFTDFRNKAYGGHVRAAEVGGTVEVRLTVLDDKLTRQLDPDVGLPLLQL
jgi:predicted DNA-binding protein with PD1-like motif